MTHDMAWAMASLLKSTRQKSRGFTVYSSHSHNLHFDDICCSLEESQYFWIKCISPNNVDMIIPESQLRIEQDLTVMSRTGKQEFSSAQWEEILLLSLWESEMGAPLCKFKINNLGWVTISKRLLDVEQNPNHFAVNIWVCNIIPY